MQKSMTIQEVAQLAGVSVATVSRVLNESPLVKEATRQKVLSVIHKFDYQPNLLGRDLRRSETMKVLVLTPSLDRPIFAEIVKGIEDRAKEDGYYVLVCPTSNHLEREKELLQMLKNRLVDGVITFSTTLSEEELSALGQKHSIVQCCEFENASYTCCVSINDEQAAFDAVSHFIELGHQRISMIGASTLLYSERLREQGYRRALTQHHIPCREEWIKHGGFFHHDGEALTNELLQLPVLPTAIFCMNDSLAIGCVNAIKKKGWSVPGDIAVIGFDNTHEATMSTPALTTVHQPKYDLGYTAMNLLIHNMVHTEKKYENVMLQHQLIKRESTLQS
ncbi:transcriptional regulator, LacI family [Paenibacillus uliginis N3/975]|uniref:Transcriptional regulator, LacI family n=1 Tax=Paenibacillus uliginis N3/975 TaxID=1313296 RepID=A0A1X7HHI8_9BACL|nr:LacI family DNA-binding transcriptional regulator [Paenibacillus uliginis]SMF86814.1 transcriptional regulator, LacI family [Paenibacillus uliginis N3/975]